jgi:aspartate ammonia-lyase
MTTRTEHDLLGVREVPACAYYGIHTVRALENFPITGVAIGSHPQLVRALAAVKQAAAVANRRVGALEPELADAIVAACEEIRAGALHDQFVVDVVQGGAGTSTNMNANEVIANRSLELLGHERGRYDVLHPIEHVNRGQSTNDTYPTALKVAVHEAIGDLLVSLRALREALEGKALEFRDLLKVGRTQLQEAVPMTLGQEFQAFGSMVGQGERLLRDSLKGLREVNLGGTAIGTGLTAPPGYAPHAVAELGRLTGIDLVPAQDRIESTQGVGAFVAASSALKDLALRLSKICNDLRLLSSGPRAGFGAITLPPVQAGSSIMPGKVNPVIPEVVNQIAFSVIGRDTTVSMAAEAGQLQLNAFEPIIALSLFNSVNELRAGCGTLAERCVLGIQANEERLNQEVAESIGLVTALLPVIGYELATVIAEQAASGTSSVFALLEAAGVSSSDLRKMVVDPSSGHAEAAVARHGNGHTQDCPQMSAS